MCIYVTNEMKQKYQIQMIAPLFLFFIDSQVGFLEIFSFP